MKQLCFAPEQELFKYSDRSARHHCFREILTFLWYETKISYRKVAKKKNQKHKTKKHCFSAIFVLAVVAIGYTQDFLGKSLEFFKHFQYMDWYPTVF